MHTYFFSNGYLTSSFSLLLEKILQVLLFIKAEESALFLIVAVPLRHYRTHIELYFILFF